MTHQLPAVKLLTEVYNWHVIIFCLNLKQYEAITKPYSIRKKLSARSANN